VDPEMRAEFEERQKSNPMNSILSGGQAGTAGGFDLAAMLAGSNKESGSSSKK
jgi:ER membrane protein complex subunit 7